MALAGAGDPGDRLQEVRWSNWPGIPMAQLRSKWPTHRQSDAVDRRHLLAVLDAGHGLDLGEEGDPVVQGRQASPATGPCR